MFFHSPETLPLLLLASFAPILAPSIDDPRAAPEALPHDLRPATVGHLAHNPGQRWGTHFDGRGFLTRPDTGGWTWGLELSSYGFGQEQEPVTAPRDTRVKGARLAYDWDSTIEEWYLNDSRGLEHGYTVRRRPLAVSGADGGPLILAIDVRGSLRPEVTRNARDVRFLDGAGAVALTYTGLIVYDADGRELEARFEAVGNQLRLSIDEDDASYPLTVDPIAQVGYLKASNADPGDNFGESAAISGDTVVVGTRREYGGSPGVNGDESDNSERYAGAAYVFFRSGVSWNQQAYLKASNPEQNDYFGRSVAISGDTIVVGADGERSSATGVNGDQSDNWAEDAGAAYVYVRSGTSWSQQAYLKASNTEWREHFGYAVAVDGDTVAVGAYLEDSMASGVNGDQSDNNMPGSGAVYVFRRSGSTWSQEAYIKASNPGLGDNFGIAVALAGDTLVVGAENEPSAATGVNGDQSDNTALKAGAAYVFVRSGTTWVQEAYLKASNTEAFDRFGQAVGISGDTIVVGARYEASAATGVNGDQGDNSKLASGAAYVFARNGTTWIQQAYIKAINTQNGDQFGSAVGVSGDRIVVAAYFEASNARGVDGNPFNNSMPNAGAVYVLERSGGAWEHVSYLKASNTEAYDCFGISLGLSADMVVAGAYGEDSQATGVNGDQEDNSSTSSGAAYTFDLEAPEQGSGFCFGDPGSGTPCPCSNDNDGSVPGSGCDNGYFSSGAKLASSGWAAVSQDTLVLSCTNLEPMEFGLYFQAENDLSPGIVWGDGLRCAGGDLRRIQTVASDAQGSSATTVSITDQVGNVLPGDVKYYQCWYRATINPPCGWVHFFNSSNGYAIQWLP